MTLTGDNNDWFDGWSLGMCSPNNPYDCKDPNAAENMDYGWNPNCWVCGPGQFNMCTAEFLDTSNDCYDACACENWNNGKCKDVCDEEIGYFSGMPYLDSRAV